jgi:hypothetical protein
MNDAQTEAAFLREMIADYDLRDLDTFYWYEKAIEILSDRLDQRFLERFLASLPIEQQVFVIGKLAAFGHREIAAAARATIAELRGNAAPKVGTCPRPDALWRSRGRIDARNSPCDRIGRTE